MPIHKNMSKKEESLLIESLITDLVLGTSMIELLKLVNKQVEDSTGIPASCFKPKSFIKGIWWEIKRAVQTRR